MLTKEEIRFARKDVCSQCRLSSGCASPYMIGRGNDERPLLAIVGDFPGQYEDKAGSIFTGGNGDLIRGLLKDLGVVANRDCYLTTAVRCKPQEKKVKDISIKLCRQYLIDDLIRVNPKLIVTLGASAFYALTGEKSLKEERGAPKLIRIQSETGGGETLSVIMLPTVHPSFVAYNASSLKFLVKDLQRAVEIAKTDGGIPERPSVSYRVVATEKDRDDFVAEMRKAKRFAWDTETTGVNQFAKDAQIVCATFSTKVGTGWLVPLNTDERDEAKSVEIKLSFAECVKLVKWALSLKRYIIGQNLKFDELFVRATLGFVPRSASFDCAIASHLIDEEASKYAPAGLKSLAFEHTLMGGYERGFLKKYPNAYKIMKALPILDAELESSLLYYACADVDVALQVCDSLTKKLKEENLMSTLSLEMQKAALLVDMEFRGARIDLDVNGELMKEFPVELDRIQSRLRQFPEVKKAEKLISGATDQSSFLEGEPFNPNSPAQVKLLCMKVLNLPPIEGKETPTGGQSTDAESLDIWCNMLDERSASSQIMRTIVEFKQMQKLFGTYVSPLPELADSNGYLHTSFNSVGTVTWRLASSKPNLMNLPRADDGRTGVGKGSIKKQFVGGRPGWWVAEADYSQIELRILALVSQDEKMLEAYFNGEDIHAKTAGEIFNCSIEEVTKVQRTRAKGVNFGVVYGQTAEGLSEALGVSLAEAERYLGAFYSRFSGAADWIQQTKDFIASQGYSQTLFGHKRRLDNVFSSNYSIREKALRQGVNSVIQGTASNMAIYAEMYLDKFLGRKGFQSYCFGQVHDSLWLTGPPEEQDEVLGLTVDVMENLPFDFLSGDDPRFPNVPPIIADISVGMNLRDLKAA